jgi:hypothetical protein
MSVYHGFLSLAIFVLVWGLLKALKHPHKLPIQADRKSAIYTQ